MFNIIFFLWGYLSPNSKCNCRFKMQLWNSFAASPSIVRATTSIGICNKIYMQKSKIKFYLSFRVSGHSLDVSLILLDLSQGINCKIDQRGCDTPRHSSPTQCPLPSRWALICLLRLGRAPGSLRPGSGMGSKERDPLGFSPVGPCPGAERRSPALWCWGLASRRWGSEGPFGLWQDSRVCTQSRLPGSSSQWEWVGQPALAGRWPPRR